MLTITLHFRIVFTLSSRINVCCWVNDSTRVNLSHNRMDDKEEDDGKEMGDLNPSLHKMLKKLKVDPQIRKDQWKGRKQKKKAQCWHNYSSLKVSRKATNSKRAPLIRAAKLRIVTYSSQEESKSPLSSPVNKLTCDTAFSFTCTNNFNINQSVWKNSISRRKRLHPSDEKYQKKRMALKLNGTRDLIFTEGLSATTNRSKVPSFRTLATIEEEESEELQNNSTESKCPLLNDSTNFSDRGAFSHYDSPLCASFANLKTTTKNNSTQYSEKVVSARDRESSCHNRWQYRNSGTSDNQMYLLRQNIQVPISNQTCSQQARLSLPQDVPFDDTTVEELAGYFDNLVHIPKKMSAMAEMMYT